LRALAAKHGCEAHVLMEADESFRVLATGSSAVDVETFIAVFKSNAMHPPPVAPIMILPRDPAVGGLVGPPRPLGGGLLEPRPLGGGLLEPKPLGGGLSSVGAPFGSFTDAMPGGGHDMFGLPEWPGDRPEGFLRDEM
jgi:hypothetical protein